MSASHTPASPWMNEELEMLRDATARFLDKEMIPQDAHWREQGHVGLEIWRKAGENGLLCTDIPASYGGGDGDFRHEAVVYEELSRRGLTGFATGVHSICSHYLLNHGTEEQKQKYLPKLASGELVGAIAMTEPGAGSDLQAIRTRAVRDGDHYVVSGSKTFISNGFLAGLLMLVVKTDPSQAAKGMSILCVETKDLPGFRVGRVLDKIGLKSQDTSELFFDEARIPVSDLLGGVEGKGFYQLMSDLPYERAIIAVQAVGTMEGALAETLRYVKERKAFGRSIAEFQNSKFKLAEIATLVKVARTFVDRCIEQVAAGTLDTATASMAKWWTTDTQSKVIDECLQLHGGYGFMSEYLIGRMYVDARIAPIYGGTNEIMKEVISRSL